MLKQQYLLFFITSIIAFAAVSYMRIIPAIPQEIKDVMTVGDLVRLFPKNSHQIEQQTKGYIRQAKRRIKDIIAIPDEERTFSNTAKAIFNSLLKKKNSF